MTGSSRVSPRSESTVLETPRLTLRWQEVSDAVVWRHLWTERDPRVPPHRRIDTEGRPTVEDIAATIRDQRGQPGLGLLTVERKDEGDVIGYCGLVFTGKGEGDEPELAFELLRAVHNRGYATEAGRAVIDWAAEAGHSRLWATVWDWNAASLRALEKLGFRDSGRSGPEGEHGRVIVTVRDSEKVGP